MGIVFSKIMALMSVPVETWEYLKGPDYLEDEMTYWVLVNVVIANVCLVGMTGVSACFGIIG